MPEIPFVSFCVEWPSFLLLIDSLITSCWASAEEFLRFWKKKEKERERDCEKNTAFDGWWSFVQQQELSLLDLCDFELEL